MMNKTMKPSTLLPRLSLVALATCLSIVTLSALPQRAQAQTLVPMVGGGAFVPFSALDITARAYADDFVFSSPQTFDQARVWLLDFSGDVALLDGFSGDLSWLIYDNNAGVPGNVLFSDTVSGAGITQTDTGVDLFGFRIFQLDFSMPSTTLGAGTYWFRIKENGPTDDFDGSDVFWLNGDGGGTGFDTMFGAPPLDPTGWTSQVPENRAFQFFASSSSAAPEPGTFALLALGMVGGIVARRSVGKTGKGEVA
jgi:PEP-CTERM motif